MLYMGYVGFAVCFSMAVRLSTGEVNSQWAKYSRPWANAAIGPFNTRNFIRKLVGIPRIRLGRLVVLGPGENASLMPWFCEPALVHSLAVTDKRNAMKSWAILLAIIAFGFFLLRGHFWFARRVSVRALVHKRSNERRIHFNNDCWSIGLLWFFYALRARVSSNARSEILYLKRKKFITCK